MWSALKFCLKGSLMSFFIVMGAMSGDMVFFTMGVAAALMVFMYALPDLQDIWFNFFIYRSY